MTLRGVGQLYRRWKKLLQDAPRLAIAGVRSEPLVKCIYANLMLGWLSQQYDFRIVLIVRHPGAVIESEMRGGWNSAVALERYRADSQLSALTNNRYASLLMRSLNPVEGLAVRWVIENQVALEEAARRNFAVAHYERLKHSPEVEWKAICRAMELPRVPNQKMISRPSQQSAAVSSAACDESVDFPRWMTALSVAQQEQIQCVLDEAGFDLYTMESASPRSHQAIAAEDAAARAIR